MCCFKRVQNIFLQQSNGAFRIVVRTNAAISMRHTFFLKNARVYFNSFYVYISIYFGIFLYNLLISIIFFFIYLLF